MHSQIDAPVEQRLFDLLREHPFSIALRAAAHLRKRNMLHRIAQRLNNLNRNFVPSATQPIRNMVRLPQRQLRPTRPNTQHSGLRMSSHQSINSEASGELSYASPWLLPASRYKPFATGYSLPFVLSLGSASTFVSGVSR